MTSFLLEGRAAWDRCQNVIKCEDFSHSVIVCETALKCAVTLKYFDPEKRYK